MRLGWVVISCFAIIQGAAEVHPRLRNVFNREEMIAWGLAELWGTSALHERQIQREIATYFSTMFTAPESSVANSLTVCGRFPVLSRTSTTPDTISSLIPS